MSENSSLEAIWKTVLSALEVDLGKSNFNLFFKNSHLLSLENGVAKIGFPNKAVSLQTSQRYYSLIQLALEKAAQTEKLSLLFEVIDRPTPASASPDTESPGPLFASPKADESEIREAIRRARLRPDFSLDEFCVSTSNQLAFAAAQAVARDPGQNYNPFFIWGGVGIGKTHLMQGIGHEILRKNPKSRIIYAACEEFTNEIIEGIRSRNTHAFKEKYRSANALLIDDIQFLSGKDTAQEEFFYTFNAVQQAGGQVVMTSDRKPSDIKDLADRLRSRFEGGLVADISTPDHELKTAICLLKAKKRGVELPETIASVVASNVDNIRTLEGTLQRVLSEAELKKLPISEALVAEILKLTPPEGSLPARIDGRFILDTVCEYYGLPIKLIKGEKRDKLIALPRQVLMWLLKAHTSMTLMEIADFLGGRDHTTVIHGIRKIDSLRTTDTRLQSELSSLQKKLTLS